MMSKISYEQFYRLKNRDDALFSLLNERPMSAGQVAKRMSWDRSTASKYLNQLARQGRLEKHKKGKVAYYGIKKP